MHCAVTSHGLWRNTLRQEGAFVSFLRTERPKKLTYEEVTLQAPPIQYRMFEGQHRSLEDLTVIPQELQYHWTAISPLLSMRNEHVYDLAVERLNHLLDEVGADEQHPLYTHGPTQSDLLEIGSQGVASDIIRSKRELNVRQKRWGLRAEQKRVGNALQRPLRSRFWMATHARR